MPTTPKPRGSPPELDIGRALLDDNVLPRPDHRPLLDDDAGLRPGRPPLDTPDLDLGRSLLLGLDDEPPGPDPARGTVVGRGFRHGYNALISIFGGAASFTGDVFNADSLQGWGRDIAREYGARAGAVAAGGDPVPSLDEVFSSEGGFGEFMRWAGFHAASGGTTAVPALIVGALGAVASPGIALAAGAAFLYGMGVGDITAAQLEARDDPNLLWAAAGGVPYAVAERLFGAGAVAARALTNTQKRNLAKSYLKRLAHDVPTAMLSEAVAESVQTMLTEGIVRLESDEPLGDILSDGAFWKAVVEGAAAGAVGGGPFGAISAIPGPRDAGVPDPGAPPVQPAQPAPQPPPRGVREAGLEEPSPELSEDDIASPLDNADIQAGREIINDALKSTEADTILSTGGWPSVGTPVNVALPGQEAFTGKITDAFDVDGEPGVTIEDAGGVAHYIDRSQGAVISPLPSPEETADRATAERITGDLEAVRTEAAGAGLSTQFETYQAEELTREGVDAFDDLVPQRKKPVISAVKKRIGEDQKAIAESEKAAEAEVKGEETDKKFYQDLLRLSEGTDPVESDRLMREVMDAEGYTELTDIPDERRSTFMASVRDSFAAEGRARAEAETAEKTRIKVAADEQKQAKEAEAAEQKRVKEADDILLYRQDVESVMATAGDLPSSFIDKATAGVRKEMGLARGFKIVEDAGRRGTYLKLLSGRIKAEQARIVKDEAGAAEKAAALKVEKVAAEKAEAAAAEVEKVEKAAAEAERQRKEKAAAVQAKEQEAAKEAEATEAEAAKAKAKPKEPPAKPPVDVEEPVARRADWGAKNKVVTRERHKANTDRLREISKRLPAGVDPEVMQIGVEMAVFHLEAGTRRFSDFAGALYDELNDVAAGLGDKLRPYFRNFYNGARDWPDTDFSAGMSPAEEVEAVVKSWSAEKEPPKEPPKAPAKRTGKMKDAGERLEGKVRRRTEQISEFDGGGDSDKIVDNLLAQTSRAKVWAIDVPKDATPGTVAYLRQVRSEIATFPASRFGSVAVMRQRSWGEQATVDKFAKSAAEYIATLEMLKEATDGSVTVDQAAAALRTALLGPDNWQEKLAAGDYSDLGKRVVPLFRAPFMLHRILGERPNQYPQVYTDEATGKKQIKRVQAKYGEEGPDRGDQTDYRKGKDVTADDLIATFGFRGVEFGDWVNSKERQNLTNYAFDAFHDLAHRLGIKPKDISFGGKLGFALGSRGRGRHAAHYEPGTNVINLTKTKGDGSIAHEWGHALDFNLVKSGTGATTISDMKRYLHSYLDPERALKSLRSLLSGKSWISRNKRAGPIESARRYVQGAYWQRAGWGPLVTRDFSRQASALGEYWKRDTEVFARSFESWVHDDMAGPSPFLVNEYVLEGFVSPSRGYRGTPYPASSDRTDFATMWQALFAAIEWKGTGPVLAKPYEPFNSVAREIKESLDAINLKEEAKALAAGEQSADGLWWYFSAYGLENNHPQGYVAFATLPAEASMTGHGRPLTPDEIERYKLRPVDRGTIPGAEDNTTYLKGDKDAKTTERDGPGELEPVDGDSRPPVAAGEAEDGEGPRGEGPLSEGAKDGGRRGSGADGGAVETGGRSTDGKKRRPRGKSVSTGRNRGSGASSRSRSPGTPGINYRITDADQLGAGGDVSKATANILAIKTLKAIEAENRKATPDEQKILVKYVGWGGLKNIFGYDRQFRDLSEEVRGLLSTVEYESARQSTLNAHYTAPEVVSAMWEAVDRLGFAGGRVLEPAVGIGHFFGLMPDKMMNASTLQGVDMDPISARISRQLYQGANIINSPYEAATLPENFFDLAISNVPFLDVAPADRKYNRNRLLLHDYYFRKTAKLVRPGGLVAFITSKGTMDKISDRARKLVDQDMDLVGAIRLPETAFKQNAGTIVTTDIIFLRRKVPGETPDWRQEWLTTADTTMPMAGEPGTTQAKPLNSYYVANPEMMLGQMMLRSGRYGDTLEAALVNTDENAVIEGMPARINDLPAAVMTDGKSEVSDGPQTEEADTGDGVKDGAVHIKNGKVYRRTGSADAAVEATPKELDIIKHAIGLRDISTEMIGIQMTGGDPKDLRKKLNRVYDALVKKHGYLGKVLPRSPWREDPDYYRVLALEKWDMRKKTGAKADIFKRNTVSPRITPDKADNADDALTISLGEKGRVDLDYMASIAGSPVNTLIGELQGKIYNDPQAGWVTADGYLSGNVREKLKIAQAAAEADEKYTPNVAALEAAIPDDLQPADISARLGAAWIEGSDIETYMSERMNRTPEDFTVKYSPEAGKWSIAVGHRPDRRRTIANSVEARSRWGTRRKSFLELMEFAVNGGFPTIKDRQDDDSYVLNQPETEQARAKLREIKEDFGTWAWSDPKRADRLKRTYNDEMNAVVLRQFDGAHLRLPGMNADFVARGGLRSHQRNAVWRILQQPSTYLAHEVGTGKTLVYITAAMEARRLGLAKKPMIAVLKKNLDQFVGDFRTAYPGANILVSRVPGEAGKRRAAISQIITGDWDAVILTHENLSRVGVSVERQMAELREQIDDAGAAIVAEGSAPSVRDLEKIRSRIQARLSDLEQRVVKDEGLSFEDLGVDMLMIDEAQKFKALPFTTTLGRQVRGLNPAGSGRSFEMWLKTKYLSEVGAKFVMGSGTPLSNSIGELYSISRYLQLDELQHKNLSHFDMWANTFGDASEVLEYKPEGGGYRKVAKFHRFVNVPELMTMVYSVMDRMTAEEAGIKRPPIEGDKPIPIVMEMTEQQISFQEALNERAKSIRASPRAALPDNMLALSNDGQLASIDMRLLGSQYTEASGTKLHTAADKVFEVYEDTSEFKGAQIIFLDQRRTTRNPGFNTHDEIKRLLAEKGIPEAEIASIHDVEGNSKVAEARQATLFEDVNSGKVRILLATTEKGGTGVNVQERIAAIHHLDVDWNFSGYIQRNGRGLRQGNTVWEKYGWKLRIYNYTTEGSVDAFKWDKVAGKAKLFERIMSGQLVEREIADISQESVSASEMVAVTSGDPRIAEYSNLEIDLRRLAILRKGFDNQQYAVQSDLVRVPKQIDSTTDLIDRKKQDAAALETADRVRIAEPGGDSEFLLDDPKTEEARNKTWRAQVERWKEADLEALPGRIADYLDKNGRKVASVHLTSGWVGKARRLEVHTAAGDSMGDAGGEALAPRKIALTIARINGDIEKAQEDLAELKRRMESLDKEVGKTFPAQKELDEKTGRMNEIKASFAADEATAAINVDTTKTKESRSVAGGREYSAEEINALWDTLGAVLKKVAPSADLLISKRSPAPTRAGQTLVGDSAVISIYLDVARDPEHTLRHEVIHALRGLGLFTRAEWRALVNRATKENWVARHGIQSRYPDLSDQAKIEEAIAEEFADRGADPGGGLVARLVARVLAFFTELSAAVFGPNASSVFRDIASGKVGLRAPKPLGRKGARESREAAKPSYKFDDPETQAAWERGQRGFGGETPPLIKRFGAYVKHFGTLWVRSHRHLPRTQEFADAQAFLRQVTAAPSVATEEIVRYLHRLTKGLSAADLEIFTLKAVVDDFQHDVKQDMEIPIFRDVADFRAEYARIGKIMQGRPDLMNLIHRRRRYVNNVKDQMVAAGMLSKEDASNPTYFRHAVLEYAPVSQAFGGTKRLAKPKIYQRKGTKLVINTRLVEVEAEWLFRALVGINTMRQITKIKDRYDLSDQVKTAIRSHNNTAIDSVTTAELAKALSDLDVDQRLVQAIKDGTATVEDDLGGYDLTGLKDSRPIHSKLAEYRRNIAVGFRHIREDTEISRDDVPAALRPMFDRIKKRGSAEGDFAVVTWLAQNTDSSGTMGAAMVLKAVSSRRQFLADTLGKDYIAPTDLARALKEFGLDGARTWQPDKGKMLFMSKSIPQHVMDRFIGQLGANLGSESGMFTNEEMATLLGSVRDQLAVGGMKPQMVLPTEIADTLDELGGEIDEGPIARLLSVLVRRHKQWLLISPRTWFRYNLQNISGDLDGVLAAFPAGLRLKKYVGPAISELWDVQIMRKEPSAKYLEAAERGVFDAGWSINEVYEAEANIGDVIQRSDFTHKNLRRLWRFFSRSTTFRENWLRYSLYLAARDRIVAEEKAHPGKPPADVMPMVGYGAAKARIVDATKDPLDRAALIARESVGDYGDLSVAGNYLRRRWMWFFSWQEINFKRYLRLGQNIWLTQKGFGKAQALAGIGAKVGFRAAAWLALRATIFFASVQLWNHLFFPDEEDELSEEDRYRLHVILGRDKDGKVVAVKMPGALSDFFAVFGYTDVMQLIGEVQKGRSTYSDILKTIALAPVNRLVQGVTPILKVPVEAITGRQVFPKFWEPRSIKDPWRHVFRTFKLEHEYDLVLGRPTRGYADSWIEALASRRDPGENAYHFIRGLGYDWAKTVKGRDFRGQGFDERARTLYYYRKALQFEDSEAAAQLRKRLRELGVSGSAMASSVRNMHPMGMLSKADRRRFLSTLTPEERRRLTRAVEWYYRIF